VPVYSPLPDTAQDLMDMYGLTAEQAEVLAAAGLDYYNHNLDTSPDFSR